MSSYINRDEIHDILMERAKAWGGSFTAEAFKVAAKLVKEAPAVDVVEVVRCKDCEYCVEEDGWFTCYHFLLEEYVDADDFCAWGERRADNGND